MLFILPPPLPPYAPGGPARKAKFAEGSSRDKLTKGAARLAELHAKKGRAAEFKTWRIWRGGCTNSYPSYITFSPDFSGANFERWNQLKVRPPPFDGLYRLVRPPPVHEILKVKTSLPPRTHPCRGGGVPQAQQPIQPPREVHVDAPPSPPLGRTTFFCHPFEGSETGRGRQQPARCLFERYVSLTSPS